MKIILICALFLPGLSNGQNSDTIDIVKKIDSLIKASNTLISQNNFEKALEINSTARKLALEKLGKETASYGSVCFNRGRVMYYKGDYPESEKWFLSAKEIREKEIGRASCRERV